MTFDEKLKMVMGDKALSQTALSAMTGIGKSSISQYLSGKHEPTPERKREIAVMLGLKENYFSDYNEEEIIAADNSAVNVRTDLVAKLMGVSKDWLEKGLQQKVFPWGYAVKRKKWSYWISSKKFTEYTGIEIPRIRMLRGEDK